MTNFRYTLYVTANEVGEVEQQQQQQQQSASSAAPAPAPLGPSSPSPSLSLENTKLPLEAVTATGRAVFTDGKCANGSLLSMVVVDRVWYLHQTFQNMRDVALLSQSTSVKFAHYSMNGDLPLPFVIPPSIAPCLPFISNKLSIQQLHDINRGFAAQFSLPFDYILVLELLIQFLSYLEMMNIVSLSN